MNVVIIYAHPEPRSLNASMLEFMRKHLERAGHSVQVSDLYTMNWKAPLDASDFPDKERGTRFNHANDSKKAFEEGRQSEDVAREQRKLLWADAVILQFPMWWYSMPAILKGWVDRVYAYGFGYGVGEHSDKHWGDRFGEGALAGKRAMLVVTTGGWEPHYGPRGVNGPIDDLLFPINHGILYYPGFDVLPPFVEYRVDKADAERFAGITETLGRRLDQLWTTAPIPYRAQNAGDYAIPSLTLHPHVAPGQAGFGAHLVSEAD